MSEISNASEASVNTANLALKWSEAGLPVSTQFNDPYFSLKNGLAETDYVFIQHNQLRERWATWQGPFCVIETGFGTGLNFLATWRAFQQSNRQRNQQESAEENDLWLHFTSIEKYPLSKEQLTQALALWPELADLTQTLLEQYPHLTAGFHHLRWPEQRISLTLIFADVHDALKELTGPVHAWYLDGFSPAKNPEMWTDELYQQMRHLSRNPQPGKEASVATFTAASQVRRGLQGAGFKVHNPEGFGGKRHMLAGIYHAQCGPEQPPYFQQEPWLIAPNPRGSREVTVIGAGLAGCHSARSLAEAGFKVTLIDALGIAQCASGNPQGGLYVKLAADDKATHTDFYLEAYELALCSVKAQLGDGDEQNLGWQSCGVMQLASSEKEAARQAQFIAIRKPPSALIEVRDSGLFYPQAGWVAPARLCEALVQHPNIRFEQAELTSLNPTGRDDAPWQLCFASGEQRSASTVVIATAWPAKELLTNAYLPVKNIRGQLTYLDATSAPAMPHVLCANSYMAPPIAGQLCLGATYNLNDSNTELRDSDHQTNLDHLKEFGDEWQLMATHNKIVGGRVGFRCTTPDYLPMVGPLADTRPFAKAFKQLSKNSKQIPQVEAPLIPGLFVNIGHGSRGLVSAPLCAEILTDLITGRSSCVSRTILDAVLPVRFLVRDIARRKVPNDHYD